MGIVTDYFLSVIAKQVDEHGLVVWYDPDEDYRGVANDLNLSDTTVICYDGSFFDLRHEIEPLMGGSDPPRLVIYVPMDQAETHDALVEAEAAGVVMKPGQQPPTRNTRLPIITRNALKPILGEEATAAIEKQVEENKLTLAELDKLAEKGKGMTQGVVRVIFETDIPQEIALKFLDSDHYDAKIKSRNASLELAILLQTEFGIELLDRTDPNEMRSRLARYILATDFLANLQGEIPSQLTTVRTASKPATRDTCIALAKRWRSQHDFRESYVDHANRVENELGLSRIDFELAQIIEAQTFQEIERALQRRVQEALFERATEDLVEIASTRKPSFWSEQSPNIQAQWSLTVVIGQLLLEADRIEQAIKSSDLDAKSIFHAYTDTESDQPWCLLDTYHRLMERRFHDLEFDSDSDHQQLEQLVIKARHRYTEVGESLTEKFLKHYADERFRLTGMLHQTEIFEKKVKPRIVEGKTAYVWVDALRYEMARELAETLDEEFEMEIQPALGMIPTITPIGMAALLPGAHESAAVVPANGNKLALKIGDTVLKDRNDRVKFLKDSVEVKVFATKLERLIPRPNKKIREKISDADLILITSQEIDLLAEEDNVPLTRQIMGSVLRNLQRAFRNLSELGVETIVFTADHGYLLGEELSSDMKIDAPGGDTVDLHRRIWVGRGGAADSSYLRAQLSDFGLSEDLEIATPWNFACFKVRGGSTAYFHGGLSPQELFIPVVTLKPKKAEPVGLTGEIEWKLIPGSQKISTRFFSIQVKGTTTSLLELVPPKVRIEIRVQGKSISNPVSASYGFEEATGDVQLRLVEDKPGEIEPNTITLMITEETDQKTVTGYLLDATSGTELARLEKVEMAIFI